MGIRRHSPPGSGVMPDRSRVVVGLARLMRQRHAAPAQYERCESGYRASAPAASDHRRFTNFGFFARTGLPCQSRRALYFRLAGHSAQRLRCAASRKFRKISMPRSGLVPRAAEIAASEPASLILIAQGPDRRLHHLMSNRFAAARPVAR
jgi:hypothetical protein